MKRLSHCAVLLLIALAYSFPRTAHSQSAQSGNRDSGFRFKTYINLVMVDVLVRDEHGKVQVGLPKEDFHIQEDGVEQPIRHFSEDELPLAVAIVLDKSGSMKFVFNELRDSAVETLNTLKPQDPVALFAFDKRIERLTDLTSDREEIARALDRLDAGGGTDIPDALYEASHFLKFAAPKERRAIVLISDNISPKLWARRHEGEVIETAQEFETDIHSIQVRSFTTFPLLIMGGGKLQLINISRITRETGGEIKHSNAHSVGKTLAELLDGLRKRYTIGYYASQKSQPGQYHRLEVRLADNKGKPLHDYTIEARHGYYTPR